MLHSSVKLPQGRQDWRLFAHVTPSQIGWPERRSVMQVTSCRAESPVMEIQMTCFRVSYRGFFMGVKTWLLDAAALGASDLVGIVAWKGGEGLGSTTLHIRRLTLTMLMRQLLSRQKVGRETAVFCQKGLQLAGYYADGCMYISYIYIYGGCAK